VPLAALQAEGFAMRGQFSPDASAEEWCERRLLSRIHHYTLKRLRAEIEPVAARDFLRFLFDWQHLSADGRMAGPQALDTVVAQLEGFEAPAAAWESEILPARLSDYEPSWLDERCLAGRIAWMRLRPRTGRANGNGRPAPVRTTPITLLPRRHVGAWTALATRDAAAQPTPRAQQLADGIKEHGASFFDDLLETSGLLRSQVEDALAELVALGLVTSDSFGGLRALLVPSSERRTLSHGRRRRKAAFGMADAGRWALVRRPAAAERRDDAIEHIARTLLARYGVVFWRLLEREAAWLPPWRDLLRVYRRLESRGELRGGRFVAGFSGEQFALPEAIGMLRATRRQAPTGQWISVSGADPLNLVGILTPGPRLPALAGNRLLYRDGIPVALFAADDIQFLEDLDAATAWTAQKALLRGPVQAPSLSPSAVDKPRREPAALTIE
jgi:ATP-dependent Lhr-like helicase